MFLTFGPDNAGAVIIQETKRMSLTDEAVTRDLRRIEQPLHLPPLRDTTGRKMVETFAWAAHEAARVLI